MCGETRNPRDMSAGNAIPGETHITVTTVIIGRRITQWSSSYSYAHAHISFTLWTFLLMLSCYRNFRFFVFGALSEAWRMDSIISAAISAWLLRALDLPSCSYEIPEIYITKKLQKLQAGKRQAVLQRTDSRWNRAWSTCCKEKWSRQKFSRMHQWKERLHTLATA